ncbi:MAG: hypothetical protein Kilf2KO_46800 [Rhodospirillales bacterium]
MASSRKNRQRHAPADRPAKIDLYDYCKLPEPEPRGRRVVDDLSDWRVVDDWPVDVPVMPEEVDVFERWFGDLLDEMFGPK